MGAFPGPGSLMAEWKKPPFPSFCQCVYLTTTQHEVNIDKTGPKEEHALFGTKSNVLSLESLSCASYDGRAESIFSH